MTDIPFEILKQSPFNESKESADLVQAIHDFQMKYGFRKELEEAVLEIASKAFDAGVFAARNCT